MDANQRESDTNNTKKESEFVQFRVSFVRFVFQICFGGLIGTPRQH